MTSQDELTEEGLRALPGTPLTPAQEAGKAQLEHLHRQIKNMKSKAEDYIEMMSDEYASLTQDGTTLRGKMLEHGFIDSHGDVTRKGWSVMEFLAKEEE